MTRPIYPEVERIKPCPVVSMKHQKKNEVNPYEVILAREVKNWFDHSQMTMALHVNSLKGEEFFNARVAFHKNGMQLKKYGSKTLELALTNTKYEELLCLSKTSSFSTAFIFSLEHKKISTVLKIIKKIPQIHLLCGVIDDRLMSKNEIVDYSKMPSIDVARSQLVNILNMAASQLVQNLKTHQENLVKVLDAHVRVNEKPIDTEKTKTGEPEKP